MLVVKRSSLPAGVGAQLLSEADVRMSVAGIHNAGAFNYTLYLMQNFNQQDVTRGAVRVCFMESDSFKNVTFFSCLRNIQ